VAESLAKLYEGGIWGVRDISFQASYGEITVLLGPNGAGKTTTINMLATLIEPTSGRGYVSGYDVVREARMVRRVIALMPQGGSPDPNWTPYEAVKWYLVARGLSISTAERETRRWLEELGMWDLRSRTCWTLSGGQRRRVLAAMVLATEAQVIFLDEPSSDLDVEGKYRVWGAVRRACSDGRAVIYTTHDMREASMLADKVVIISGGRTLAIGRPRELIESLPFRYRIVVRNSGKSLPGFVSKIDMGGMSIAYYQTRSEALSSIEDSGVEEASVEHVGLEDVYLYYVKLRGDLDEKVSSDPR